MYTNAYQWRFIAEQIRTHILIYFGHILEGEEQRLIDKYTN